MARNTRLVQAAVIGNEHSDIPVVLPRKRSRRRVLERRIHLMPNPQRRAAVAPRRPTTSGGLPQAERVAVAELLRSPAPSG
ncbi:hypothetical protein GCM10011579_034430 [Streptomyces albiflavescens]|uniref:Uncharacterized protein n=1 Tax=Streptomyces albiflavescens TaxID=1623582 RepID=A0A918D4G1_9ACTN|nr:hypothetical protein GCM10011579_034430 [Streptomyces albiflavescens]